MIGDGRHAGVLTPNLTTRPRMQVGMTDFNYIMGVKTTLRGIMLNTNINRHWLNSSCMLTVAIQLPAYS